MNRLPDLLESIKNWVFVAASRAACTAGSSSVTGICPLSGPLGRLSRQPALW
jgi:hypothetical protein